MLIELEPPEVTLWRFAPGCLDARLLKGDLNRIDYDTLVEHAIAQETPSRVLLERVFPRPYEAIRDMPHLSEAVAMRHYWYVLHRAEEETTPVYLAMVYSTVTAPGGIQMATVGYLDKNGIRCIHSVTNFQRLVLGHGDKVLVHGGTLADYA